MTCFSLVTGSISWRDLHLSPAILVPESLGSVNAGRRWADAAAVSAM